MDGLKIIALGSALPGRLVSNDELSHYADTSDEWIFPRTGIHDRYFCEKEESAMTLAVRAAREALGRSGIDPSELGAVVVATMSADFATPSLACLVARELGCPETIPALDLNAACSGFVYGLEVARGLLLGNGGRYALLIGTEQLSRLLDLSDRTTSILFGDGAGAAVLERSAASVYESFLGSRGDASILAPGTYTGAFDGFYSDGTEDESVLGSGVTAGKHQKVDHMLMDGKSVFLFAIDIVPRCIEEILKKSGRTMEEISHVVCHQANSRIIRNVVRHMKADPGKFFEDMEHYGNTSGASIPLALDDMRERGLLQRGEELILVGFGGGLTWASAILCYEPPLPKDPKEETGTERK